MTTRNAAFLAAILGCAAVASAEEAAVNSVHAMTNQEESAMGEGTCAWGESCVAGTAGEAPLEKDEEVVNLTQDLLQQPTTSARMASLSQADEAEEDEDEEENDDDEDYDEDEEEDEYGQPGSEFGVRQIVDHKKYDEEEVWDHLNAVERYMYETVWEMDFFDRFPKVCWNQNEQCTLWAMDGECDANREFMLETCAPACFACHDELGPGSEFGATQVLEHEEVDNSTLVLQKLNETRAYIENTILVDDFYEKVRDLCYNRHELCTVWAVQGYCTDESEQDYMFQACAPACEKCEHLHYDTRCPLDPVEFPDIFQPGDVNKMFERIVADEDYKVNVWSRPDYLEGDDEETAEYEVGPWIITIDDFIHDDIADRLVAWGNGRYERSEEVGGVDEETGEALESVVSEDRTSRNAWCQEGCEMDPIVVDLFYRIHQLTGVPADYSESLQLLKYEPGEYYLTHHDYIPESHKEPGGPRILTVFMYLNDVEEGGGTRFDWHDMIVTPKKGSVAIWPSVLDEDPTLKDERTEHEAMPVIQGKKFGANAWLHLRNYTKAGQQEC